MGFFLRIIPLLMVFAAASATAGPVPELLKAVVESGSRPENLKILDQRGHWWLVEGTAEQLAAWPDAKPVPQVPVFEAAATRSWANVTAADPLIQNLVDQVQWTDLLDDVNDIVGWGNRYSYNSNIDTVADSLVVRLGDLGLATEKHQFTLGSSTPFNVIATQTGSIYPDSVFVVCAHYDATSENTSVGTPGADDNASGVTAVLTCARLFAPLNSAYTIKYVLFAGEEQYIVGSQAWASDMAAAGLAIVGAMNVDMIGWWQPGVPFDLEIETNKNSRWMANAITNAADLYTDMSYILHVDDSAWWGDFYSFWQNGFNAVNHEESWDWGDPDFNPNYHSLADLPAGLSEPFMTGSVKIVVAGMATLAQVSQVSGVDVGPVAVHSVRVTAAPNPFNGRTTLHFEYPGRDGVFEVEIFDLSGRRVGLETVTLSDGRGTASWSAKGPSGETLPTGVYLARVAGQGGTGICRLVYVK